MGKGLEKFADAGIVEKVVKVMEFTDIWNSTSDFPSVISITKFVHKSPKLKFSNVQCLSINYNNSALSDSRTRLHGGYCSISCAGSHSIVYSFASKINQFLA